MKPEYLFLGHPVDIKHFFHFESCIIALIVCQKYTKTISIPRCPLRSPGGAINKNTNFFERKNTNFLFEKNKLFYGKKHRKNHKLIKKIKEIKKITNFF
jgi:hypothetical protein